MTGNKNRVIYILNHTPSIAFCYKLLFILTLQIWIPIFRKRFLFIFISEKGFSILFKVDNASSFSQIV